VLPFQALQQGRIFGGKGPLSVLDEDDIFFLSLDGKAGAPAFGHGNPARVSRQNPARPHGLHMIALDDYDEMLIRVGLAGSPPPHPLPNC